VGSGRQRVPRRCGLGADALTLGTLKGACFPVAVTPLPTPVNRTFRSLNRRHERLWPPADGTVAAPTDKSARSAYRVVRTLGTREDGFQGECACTCSPNLSTMIFRHQLSLLNYKLRRGLLGVRWIAVFSEQSPQRPTHVRSHSILLCPIERSFSFDAFC
jgi:hypothetical protein